MGLLSEPLFADLHAQNTLANLQGLKPKDGLGEPEWGDTQARSSFGDAINISLDLKNENSKRG